MNNKAVINTVMICTLLLLIVLVITHIFQKEAIAKAVAGIQPKAQPQCSGVAEVKGFADHLQQQVNSDNKEV